MYTKLIENDTNSR